MPRKLEIKLYGCSVLTEKAKPVEQLNEETQNLIDDMISTLYFTDGVGLAAPQIGISQRIFVCDPEYHKTEEKNALVFINPEFIEYSGEQEYEEGCLSIPNVYEKVIRFEKVKIKYRDRTWTENILEAEDTFAVILQHEFDHLEGKLFVDQLSKIQKMTIAFKLNKIKNKGKNMEDKPVVIPSIQEE